MAKPGQFHAKCNTNNLFFTHIKLQGYIYVAVINNGTDQGRRNSNRCENFTGLVVGI